MSEKLTYQKLKDAVDGGAVALRSILKLQPVDGPGGKIFPPTYLEEGRGTKYAFEERISESGEKTQTVLIDSVASQANRAEQALLRAWEDEDLAFPVPYVDFGNTEEFSHFGRVTVLDAPHRLADAIFRDSLLGDDLFRLTDIGEEIFRATTRNATALYRHAPTCLLFGQWDSTGPGGKGPDGNLGAKFQRAYVSEIVGFNALSGVKVGSRIDPLEIEKSESKIFKHEDPTQQWTLDEAEARKDGKGKPILYEKGDPSNVNHGNIPPTVDQSSGGVTISEAMQTSTISLAGLRRLRFPGQDELAARTAIAALGIAALAYSVENDFDLRSRCFLVPAETMTIDLIPRDGSSAEKVKLDGDVATAILQEASDAADKSGIGWSTEPMILEPSQKFTQLLSESRKLSDTE